MKCHGCSNSKIGNRKLTCNTCKSTYCYDCLNIKPEDIPNINQDYVAHLKCPSCAFVTRRKNTDSTPVNPRLRRAADDSMNMSFDTIAAGKTAIASDNTSTLSQVPTLEEISQLLDDKLSISSTYMTSLREVLKEELRVMVASEVQKAIQSLKDEFTTTTDFIVDEQSDIKRKLCAKDSVIASLESELLRTQSDCAKVTSRLSQIEKLSRDLNIEIQEVPESKSENLFSMLKNLCSSLEVPIADSDIRSCRRVAKMDSASRRPRNVLATFNTPRLRDSIISATLRFNKSHSKEKLNTSHLGLAGESKRVYVTEHLAPETKQLHAAARKFAKDKNFKFVWVRYGRVYLRKDENTKGIHLKNLDSLNNLELKS